MMKNDRTVKVVAQGDREIVMTRIFDAPKRLVYDAFTKPELVKRWLMPPCWEMPVCEIDLRVGGAYKYVWKQTNGGMEMAVSGVYRELAAPDRIVHTEVFTPAWYVGENVITTVFTEKDGQTYYTATMRYVSSEARDTVLQSPMESGINASYRQLDVLLEKEAAPI